MGILWDEKWSIGNKLIDSQHKTLVKLVNDLVFSSDEKGIPAALSFLVNYTATHFKDEEALQKSCGFPGYIRHKELHRELTVTVGKLVAEYQKAGSTAKLKHSLDKVLASWLINHIEVEDKKIGDYILSKKK